MTEVRHEGGIIALLRTDRALRWILVLCLVLRLAYCFFVFPVIADRLHWRGADDGYDEIARSLLHGDGYKVQADELPNLVTPPGYVAFLYLVYGATGEEVNEGIRIHLLHPVLDTLTCLLIYLMGLRVFRRRRVALLSALAWAVYPQMLVYSARLAPEVVFVLLFTGMVLALLRLLDEGHMRDAALVGLLWGLAVLTKEKLIFLPPIILLLTLRYTRGRAARRLALALVTCIVMAAVVAPWVARGYRVTGIFVPITLRSGRALKQGMDEDFSGADQALVEFFEGTPEEETDGGGPGRHEREEDVRAVARGERAQIGTALSRILADPGAYVKAFFIKLGAYWYFGQPKVIVGNILIQIPILLLAIAGYIRGWRSYRLLPFLILTLYFMIIHALTIVRMRYSLPIMPEMILVAAYFVVAMAERRRPAAASPVAREGRVDRGIR
ncbi:glycosyltransferase family 39 protein [bacterium]|nr:glycosyltransferase family 39 protein [bacterium]